MASHTNGTGVINGIAGTFTYTPPGGGSAAVINGIISATSLEGTHVRRKDIMSQAAGITVGSRMDDEQITGSVSGSYLTSGTTVYLKRGGILVLASMQNSDHNKTYEIMSDAHNYASGEDVEFTVPLRWCEGYTATAKA